MGACDFETGQLVLRYALYFTPAKGDPLVKAAADWLGRDAFTGRNILSSAVEGFEPDELAKLTGDPRRYGFHATLKAPFELAANASELDLLRDISAFASTWPAFEIPEIGLEQLGPFFALTPVERCRELHAFADAVVERFEPFRAPLSAADIARRHPERLQPRERENLHRWGYPHVFDCFQFHMTLTGPVTEDRQGAMRPVLQDRFAPFLGSPLAIDSLAVFVEPARGAPFTVHSLWPLGGMLQGKTI